MEVRGSAEGSSSARFAERGLIGVVLLALAARVVQAAITVGLGGASYSNQWRSSGAFLLALIGSTWIGQAIWRQGHARGRWLVAQELVALACLGLVASATHPADLTTSFNWSLPFAQSSALVLSLAARRQIVLASGGAVVLCAAYLLSIAFGSDRPSFDSLPSAGGNAVGILAHYIGGALVVEFVRRQAAEIDNGNKRADSRDIELSAARTRGEEFRRLHDDAVQVLERVAAELNPRSSSIRHHAQRAAQGLRAVLSGQQPRKSLAAALIELSQHRDGDGMKLTVDLPNEIPDLDLATVEAIAAATNEAITNVRKHANSSEAVVVVRTRDNELEVSVRDCGIGFNPSEIKGGFGLAGSIGGPIEHVGGNVSILSAPGAGTVVTMRVPVRALEEPMHRPATERLERLLVAVVLASRAVYIVYAAVVVALNHAYYSNVAVVLIGLLLAAMCAFAFGVFAWRHRRITLPVATLDALTSGLLLVLVTQSLPYYERVGSRNWALAYVVASVLWLALGKEWPARLALATLLGLTYFFTVVVGGTPTTVLEVTALANAVTPPIFFGVAFVVYAMLEGLAAAADRVHAVELGQRREVVALREREELFRRVHLPTIRALETISVVDSSQSDGEIRKLARSTSRLVRQVISAVPQDSGRAALRREIEALESVRVQIDVIDDLLDREPRAVQIDTLSHALGLAIAEADRRTQLDLVKIRVTLSSIEDDLAMTVRLPGFSDRDPLRQAAEVLQQAGGELTRLASVSGEVRLVMRVPW